MLLYTARWDWQWSCDAHTLQKKITVKTFVKSIDNCLKKAVSMPIVQWSECCAGTKSISYTIFLLLHCLGITSTETAWHIWYWIQKKIIMVERLLALNQEAIFWRSICIFKSTNKHNLNCNLFKHDSHVNAHVNPYIHNIWIIAWLITYLFVFSPIISYLFINMLSDFFLMIVPLFFLHCKKLCYDTTNLLTYSPARVEKHFKASN